MGRLQTCDLCGTTGAKFHAYNDGAITSPKGGVLAWEVQDEKGRHGDVCVDCVTQIKIAVAACSKRHERVAS